jgi:hypothetical protein
MTKSTLHLGIVTAVSVAAVCTFIIWQRNANTRLRQELNLLREENTRLVRLSEKSGRSAKDNQDLATSKTDYNELTRVRDERLELLRLRGEVGVLRSQLTDAQRQAATNKARPLPASDPRAIANREAAVQGHAIRAYVSDWAQAFYNYGFADGSTWQQVEPAGTFEEWEKAPQRPPNTPPPARRHSLYGQG